MRVLSNNPDRGSNNWRGRVGGRGFRPRFPVLPRRVVRTLMKRDPTTAQGEPGPLIGQGVKAVLTTAMAGADNDLTFTAKEWGVGGNSVRVAFVNPGGTVGRTIVVAGKDITVNLAVTAGAINGTETATSIAASLNADAAASALISAAVATGNSGAGVVAAFALTALAGGVTNFTELRQNGPGGRVRQVLGREEDTLTRPSTAGKRAVPDRGRNTELETR